MRREPSPLVRGLAWGIQLTWGLPQTVLGAAFTLAHAREAAGHYRTARLISWKRRAGLSLGPFLFLPKGTGHALVVHEYGHTVQSLLLGPFYLPLVVLPSLLWAGTDAARRYRQRTHIGYYDAYPEHWANRLAHAVTGECPEGWRGRA